MIAALLAALLVERARPDRAVDLGERLLRGSALNVTADSPAFRRWFGRSQVRDEAGRPLVVWHGSDAWVASFDLSQAGRRTRGGGLGGPAAYFTSDRRIARSYATHERVRGFWLRIEDPLVVDAEGGSWLNVFPEVVRQARSEGRDGVIVRRVRDPARWWDDHLEATTYAVFSAGQVKSVTNVGRFDPDDERVDYGAVRGARCAGSRTIARGRPRCSH